MEVLLMVAAVLFLALLFLGVPAMARAIARRKRLAPPPAHPANRRREALSRAAEPEWKWPR